MSQGSCSSVTFSVSLRAESERERERERERECVGEYVCVRAHVCIAIISLLLLVLSIPTLLSCPPLLHYSPLLLSPLFCCWAPSLHQIVIAININTDHKQQQITYSWASYHCTATFVGQKQLSCGDLRLIQRNRTPIVGALILRGSSDSALEETENMTELQEPCDSEPPRGSKILKLDQS